MEDPLLAAGFWGAFFGSAVLMLAASVAAWLRSRQRVALLAAMSAAVAAFCVAAYLGWVLPVGEGQDRLLAHVVVGTAVVLGLMMLSMRGVLRHPATARRAMALLVTPGVVVLGAGWFLPPGAALALATLLAYLLGFGLFGFAIRALVRRERESLSAVVGVGLVLIAVGGLTWIAADPAHSPWWAHAICAVAATGYLAVMASALWSRYSYLLELSEVLAHGPSYDPVTRLRSHSETSHLIGSVFYRAPGDTRSVGVLVVTVANLYSLENLHGRAACNHALFVCASRLGRAVPKDVEMGRLGDDSFLLLLRHAQDDRRLHRIARQVHERLSRPVVLSTRRELDNLDEGRTRWTAEVGVAVLVAPPGMPPSQALATARSMGKAAWAYPSRLAGYDPGAGKIVELPSGEAAQESPATTTG
ncbi:MAG: GGDEF domain-containing protein [Burkholderiales bacterium]|nr:GGDEF domain-containing protein [Burkholderiales bacterium]